MSNGKEMLNGLELEDIMKGMGERDLIKFNIRTTHQILIDCAERDKEIKELQKGDKKRGSVSGGVTSAVIVGIYALIDFFMRRGGV